jgi:hypothetical protein
VFLLFVQNAYPQTWESESLKVSVAGYESSECNPAIGDEVNMKRCSLKVAIIKEGYPPIYFVLPWETVQVQDAVVVDQSIVFIGTTQAGFRQITVFSVKSHSIIYSRLAQKVAWSPRHNFLAYQAYQPPHGMESPHVRIEMLSVHLLNTRLMWDSSTTSDEMPNAGASTSPTGTGETLCSNNLFWSADEEWLGFCTQRNITNSDKLILVSATNKDQQALVRNLDTKQLCQQMAQSQADRCTIVISQMLIRSNMMVEVNLRSAGSSGYKSEQAEYSFTSFNQSKD